MPGEPRWALDDEIITMRPQPGLDHVGHRDLTAVEGPRQVHVDQPLPGLRRDLGERRPVHHTRAGDQDVHRSEFGAHLGEGFLHGGAVADVGGHRQRRHAFGAQLLGDPLGRIAVEVEHGHLVPTPAELAAGRFAHAGCASGHHRDAVHARPSHSLSSLLVDHADCRLVGRD